MCNPKSSDTVQLYNKGLASKVLICKKGRVLILPCQLTTVVSHQKYKSIYIGGGCKEKVSGT